MAIRPSISQELATAMLSTLETCEAKALQASNPFTPIGSRVAESAWLQRSKTNYDEALFQVSV
jgi:hypothetical protein